MGLQDHTSRQGATCTIKTWAYRIRLVAQGVTCTIKTWAYRIRLVAQGATCTIKTWAYRIRLVAQGVTCTIKTFQWSLLSLLIMLPMSQLFVGGKSLLYCMLCVDHSSPRNASGHWVPTADASVSHMHVNCACMSTVHACQQTVYGQGRNLTTLLETSFPAHSCFFSVILTENEMQIWTHSLKGLPKNYWTHILFLKLATPNSSY